MASITLNGREVEVKLTGCSSREVEIGERGTEADGGPIEARRGLRREWTLAGVPGDQGDQEDLIGLVEGLGQQWAYREDLVSSKGLYPSQTPVATIIPGEDLQSPPKKVYLESSGELEAYFGAGALEMGPATENLLPADSRDAENAPTGYVSFNGGTIAGESTIILQGAKSLKVTTVIGGSSGARTNDTAAPTATNVYTGSVYVYTTEALALRLRLYDNSANTETTWTSTPNVWERVEVTHTAVGTSYLRLAVYYPPATAGKIFYCDMWQVEEQSQATPWVDGTRATKDLRYDNIAALSDTLTFCCWTRPPTTSPSDTPVLFWIGKSGDEVLQVYRQASTNDLVCNTVRAESTTTHTAASTPWDDGWHHVAVVLNANDSTLKIYIDGTQEVSDTLSAAEYPLLTEYADWCFVGGAGSASSYWRGPILEAFCVPYAMNAAHISALASRTTETPGLPELDMGGDLNPYAVSGQNFGVLGEVASGKYTNAGTGEDNENSIIGFKLLSVEEP